MLDGTRTAFELLAFTGIILETILVTGGAGFLGGWFVRHWLTHQRDRVVVLDNLTYAGNMASLAAVADDPRLLFRRGDIADGPLLMAILKEFQPWAIVNFAAETHVDRSIDAPAPFVTTNVVGTTHLLEAALRYWRRPGSAKERFRFLQISSDEVFGPVADPHRSLAADAYRPSSPYAASKAAADHFVRAYHRTYGLPVVLVHPSNCYGPYQFPEKLVPLAILNAISGQSIPVYGDGSQQRDWLFGEDLCRALDGILQEPRVGESFNIATGTGCTNLSLVRKICSLVDQLCPNLPHAPCDRLIHHVANRPGHDDRYALDTTTILATGWLPQTHLLDGLRQTVRWYIDHRDWVDQVAAHFDRTRRMGLETQNRE